MSTRPLILSTVVVLSCCPAAWSQSRTQPPSPPDGVERPKVVIIQYESGRVLVARERNGEVLVTEPGEGGPELLSAYLDPIPVDGAVRRVADGVPGDPPMFFSPYWYQNHAVINVEPPNDASPAGRATERFKQNAAELRQQVQVRRAEQGVEGIAGHSGQVYPGTAADQERDQRLARVQRQVGGGAGHGAANGSGWTPDTFYGLGEGLEYYRQQELAARRELAMLTYDVLLEEGLAFFSQRRYGQAARSFIAATQKDQGDPGSRLHAAQCLMATGLYRQAVGYVHRAFELSPQLVYRPMNHRANYAFPEDYDRHLELLVQHVRTHPEDDAAWLLLAYQQFFSDNPMSAAEAMKRVSKMSRRNGFARRLWKAAQPVFGDLADSR